MVEPAPSPDDPPHRVAVAGCGLMGSGIAEAAAVAGLDVLVLELDDEALAAGRSRVERSLAKAVEKGKQSAESRDRAMRRIGWTTRLEDLGDREIVVEAIVEALEPKVKLFRALDEVLPRDAVLGTNTSSLPVTDLAAATAHPERVVGIHFFNPVPVMKLVELVTTLVTSGPALARAEAFVAGLGKEAIRAPDRSGFVVNRLLVPYLLDAIREVEAGTAGVAEIDRAMVLGCGHPMGPLALCDFVGNDTLLRISEIMFQEFRERRFAPPALLRRVVAVGWTGRKAGRGFYDWSEDPPRPLRP
jgi:3-hydroxybutyryl-CoA dehydrogenase